MRFLLLLLCALGTSAFAQALQPTSVTLTKGTLSFDATAITFHTKDKDHQYPFPQPKISNRGPLTPQIPGLIVQNFEERKMVPANGEPGKNISRLTLSSSDVSSIKLVAGQPTEVYRIEMTFADQRQIVLWQSAAQLK